MICCFLCLRIMVINLEQKKIHFDLRFILTYNIYTPKNAPHANCNILLLASLSES